MKRITATSLGTSIAFFILMTLLNSNVLGQGDFCTSTSISPGDCDEFGSTSTAFAEFSLTSSCFALSEAAEGWYWVTGASNGTQYTVEVDGAVGVDIVLTVYGVDGVFCDTAGEVICDDSTVSDGVESVTFTYNTGAWDYYYINVLDWGGDNNADFTISLYEVGSGDCGGGGGATCGDGIMNGDETGIDCGGASCSPCGGGTAESDCSGATLVCSSGAVSYNPTGPGNNDFAGGTNDGCLSVEHLSAWYYFEINASAPAGGSTLTFTITPDDGNLEDYDFAIYDASVGDCDNLGDPIRCSFAASGGPGGTTSLQVGAGDVSEDSFGDSFVDPMTVFPGEGYYLLVDNYSSSNMGFSINWGGVAGGFLDCTANPSCVEDAGTFDIAIDGVSMGSSCGTFDVESGSEIVWTSNGDQTLASGGNTGIVYVIFDSDPSGLDMTDPATFTSHPSVLGGDPDNTAPYTTEETSCGGLSGTNASWPSTVWVVPVTADFASIPYTIDTDFDGCVDAGCITQINYVYNLPTFGCGDVFTDPGGSTNDYCANLSTATTNWLICPDNPGESVELDFTAWDVESFGAFGGDRMFIYDGDDDSAPLIGEYSGFFGSPGMVTSTSASGCLYVAFESDGSAQNPGWEATVNCSTPPTTPCDCNTPICGGQHFDCSSDAENDFLAGSAALYDISPDLPTGTGITYELCWAYTTGADETTVGFVNAIGNTTGANPSCSFSRSYHVYPSDCGTELTSGGPSDFGTGFEYSVSSSTTYHFCVEISYLSNDCGDLADNYVWLYNAEGGGSCGTCASPCTDGGIAGVDTYDDRNYTSCWSPDCSIYGPTSVTNCFEATADATGFLGFANQIQNDGFPGCINISWELFEQGNCGSVIANPVPNANGVGSGFNPEYSGLTPNGNYVLCVEYDLPDFLCGFEGGVDGVCIDYYGSGCVVPALANPGDQTACESYTLPTISGSDLTGSQAYYDDSQANGGNVITGPITTPGTTTVWIYDGVPGCEDEISFDVTITDRTDPTFTNPGPLCETDSPVTLATTSDDGITGSWSPATVDPSGGSNVVATFTPDGGQCANSIMMTIVVNGAVDPLFTNPGPLCQNDSPVTLPTLSNNGISGSWSPAMVDPSGGSDVVATFTPDGGQCANSFMMTIVVDGATDPTFTNPGPLCETDSPVTLATTSDNGITGSWSPATVDPSGGSDVVATFTPDGGQCANSFMMTIVVNAATDPTFTNPGLLCETDSPVTLATTSDNGITGSWSPAAVDPSGGSDVVATFTPDGGQCANSFMMTIVVNAATDPTFTNPGPLCETDSPVTLATTSDDGITGSWSPATVDPSGGSNVVATFTPDGGQCANSIMMTIVVNGAVDPLFTNPGPLCQNDSPVTLPTLSNNGISGSWSPAMVDPSGGSDVVATFTPDGGQCANSFMMTIVVDGATDPTFTNPGPLCETDSPVTLATTSDNGITGSWSPATVDPSGGSDVVATFTPDGGQCANSFMMTIVVNAATDPTFTNPGLLCETDSPVTLATTSDNGITGSWSPAAVDPSGGSDVVATFTPDGGQCANSFMMTIVVNAATDPTFTNPGPLCETDSPVTLATTSDDGITGSWSPATVDPSGGSNVVATFTPDGGQCANSIMMTIVVNGAVDPLFTNPGPLCQNDSPVTLPTLSNNGISGSWSPAMVDPSGGSDVVATFTPDGGQCANSFMMTIVVDGATDPTFTNPGPLCETDSPVTLATTSDNGITGSWSPATVDPSGGSDVVATFTPDGGQCANSFMMTIVVNAATDPTFTNPGPLCETDSPVTLATTSDNGITGSWSPATVDPSGGSDVVATFTPDGGQCANSFMMTIVVDGATDPTFTNPGPLCETDSPVTLATTSDDGITGSWSPATVDPSGGSNVVATFTPDGGQCANSIMMTIVVNGAVDPLFTNPGPLCQNDSPVTLPTLSNNGISGSWSPAMVDPSGGSDVVATFTPDGGQCANSFMMTIVVDGATDPTFTNPGPLCETDSPVTLATTSDNGITGSWSPATVDPSGGSDVVATFTPDGGQCANSFMMTIVVNAATDPTFTNPGPLCETDSPVTLATTSDNGITGSWSPATVDPSGGSDVVATFTPDGGQCANSFMMTIVVNAATDPTFTNPGPLCETDSPVTLATTSDNGITGSWSPATVDPSGGSNVVATFTPDGGQCANSIMMTIVVNGAVDPLFTNPGPLCQNDSPVTLPTLSNNGISGSWSPAMVDPSGGSDVVATFTPDGGQCANSFMMTIVVDGATDPTFTNPGPLCETDSPVTLATTSDNGITGSWSPATVDPSGGSDVVATFTPDGGQCANSFMMTIVVNAATDPTFTNPGPLCETDSPVTLATTSDNGITGSWSPATVDPSGGSDVVATFTPDGGQCANSFMMTIVVDGATDPTFTNPGPLCETDSPVTLATTSDDGITGSWSPATVDPSGGSNVVATFTPDGGQCANSIMMTIVVNGAVDPLFTNPGPLCQNDSPVTLPTLSNNGISGSWSPATVDPSGGSDVVATFTPDGGQCANSFMMTITVDVLASISSIDPQNPSDCGIDDGTITVNVSTGTFEYSIDNGVSWQLSNVFSSLGAGNYTVLIREPGVTNCEVSVSTTLITPSAPIIDNINSSAPDDCNSDNGSITIDATGGVLEYSIDGGLTWQTDNTFTMLSSGSYDIAVRVVNTSGCETVDLVILTGPVLPTIDAINVSNLTDCGLSDGIISVDASGDMLEYSLDGVNWQSSNQFTGLSENMYTVFVRVMGTNSCEQVGSAEITAPTVPVINDVMIFSPSDCGLDNGSITVDASGNNLEYSIDGINWQSSSNFNGLPGGDYTVLVRDANATNCAATDMVSLTAPVLPVIDDVATVDPSDCGIDDGTISITASGNNLEYSIDCGASWQSSNTFGGLGSGSYCVQVREVGTLSCVAEDNVSLSAPAAPAITSIDVTPASDCGAMDGTITINATGMNLEYSIDNGANWQTSNVFGGLVGGLYDQIIVRDANSTSCTATSNATVVQPVAPVIDDLVTVNPSDCGLMDGLITIIASGNNLEYSIDNGVSFQSGNIFLNLGAGSYDIIVQVAGTTNCQVVDMVSLQAPAAPVISMVDAVNPNDCGINNGSITITASGNDLEYSIDGGVNWQSGSVFNGLSAGDYDIIVRELAATNCAATDMVSLTAPVLPVIDDVATVDPSDCGIDDGTISITASGNNLEYSIDCGASWQISNTFGGLGSGSYCVQVREVGTLSCVAEDNVSLSAPAAPAITSIDVTPASDCGAMDGTITINATGMNLEYSIDNGANWQTSNVFGGLVGGLYDQIIVRDANSTSCTATSNATVVQPVAPVIDDLVTVNPSDCGLMDGLITIIASGNNLEYSIDNGVSFQSGNIFLNLGAGSYDIIVQVAGTTNCQVVDMVSLQAPAAPVISMVDAVNPNDCGINNGSITITASGNDLEYSIDGGVNWQSGSVFNGLSAGDYDIIVRELAATNCAATDMVSLTAPVLPVIDDVATVDPSDCGIDDGTISITASGNNLEYSIDCGASWQISNTFGGLGSGSYCVQVREVGTLSCVAEDNVSLSAPAAPAITSIDVTPASDCGAMDGTITINATGMNLEYSIDNGANWQTSNVFGGLVGGLYDQIIVRDANSTSCTATSNATVVQPVAPVIDDLVTVNPSDCGLMDGLITIIASGNNLEYSIDNGVSFQSGNIFLNLGAGSYDIIVQVAGTTNCQVVDMVSLQAPAAPVISMVDAVNPNDCGINNGSITITASGNDLEYSIDGGVNWQSGSVFNGLSAGDYDIIVRELAATNCAATDMVSLTAPVLPVIDDVATVDPSDCGIDDGTISITASGNNLEYSIDCGASWQISNTFGGLGSGSYCVQVREVGTLSCVAEDNVSLSAPAAPAITSIDVTPASDCGAMDGTITINATGMNLEYSIDNGANWQTSNVFGGLVGGLYDQIIVRDANSTSCTATSGATVDSPQAPLITAIDFLPISDCGQSDASITIEANGVNLEYSIDNGINWQGSNTFAGLSAGDYDILVREISSNNCLATGTVTIPDLMVPVINSTDLTNPSDCNLDDGSIIVNADGTDLEYSLDNLNWQTANSFTGLAGGSYTVFVRVLGTLSCVATVAVELDLLEVPIINDVLLTNPSDCGVSDGSIEVQSSSTGIEYSIDCGTTWQSTGSFNGLGSGNYCVIVRVLGTNACTATENVSLSAPSAPVINELVSASATDCGVANGMITVDASGNNLEYSIDGGVNWQASNVFNSLGNGLQTVIVRDALSTNCSASASTTLVGPEAPVIAMVQTTPLSDCGVSDASITVLNNETGVEYSIDGGVNWQASNNFVGLTAGTYDVVVRLIASPNCSANEMVTIAPVNLPIINEVTVQNPGDCGVDNGGIMITATGGMLEYSIDDGATWSLTATFNNLAAGNYDLQVRVVGSTNCLATEVASLLAPAVPVINGIAPENPSDCGTSDGRITIDASGDMLEYSIDGGTTWSPTPIFDNLAGGDYDVQVRVIGSNNCVASGMATLAAPMVPVVVQLLATDVTDCDNSDGRIEVEATGNNLEYSIDGTNWQASNIFDNLPGGNFTVIVREIGAVNCRATETANISGLETPEITNVTAVDPACMMADGTIAIQAAGSNLEYSIDGVNWQTSNSFSGLPAGDYLLLVRIINTAACETESFVSLTESCSTVCEITVATASVTDCNDNGTSLITEDDLFTLEIRVENPGVDSAATYEVSDGTLTWGPFAYGETIVIENINSELANRRFFFSDSANPSCNTDANVVFIPCLSSCEVYGPTGFSPNSDGINDVYVLYGEYGECVEAILEFNIFDRWGGNIYSTTEMVLNDAQYGWDGTDRGQDATVGVYVFYAKLLLTNGKEKLIKGEVLLVR